MGKETLFTKIKNFIFGEVFPGVPLAFPYSKFNKKILSVKVSDSICRSLDMYLKKINTTDRDAAINQIDSLTEFRENATEFSELLIKKLTEYKGIIEKANTHINNSEVFNYFNTKHIISQKLLEIKENSKPNPAFSTKSLKEVVGHGSTAQYFKFKDKSLEDFQKGMCKCIDYTFTNLNDSDFDLTKLGIDLKSLEKKYNLALNSKPYADLEKMAKAVEGKVDEKQKNIGTILKEHLEKNGKYSYPGAIGIDKLLEVSKKYREIADRSRGQNITLFIENASLYLTYYNAVQKLNNESGDVKKLLSNYSNLNRLMDQLFKKSKEYESSIEKIKKKLESTTSNKCSKNSKKYLKQKNKCEKIISELESQLKSYNENLRKIESLKKDSKNIEKLNTQASKIENILQKLDKMSTDLDSISEEIIKQDEEKEKLKKEISKLMMSIDDNLLVIEGKIPAYKEAIPKESKGFINSFTKITKNVNKLKKDYNSLSTDKLKKLKKELIEYSTDIDEILKKINILSEKVYDVSDKLKDQTDKINNLKSTLDNLISNHINGKIIILEKSLNNALEKVEKALKEKPKEKSTLKKLQKECKEETKKYNKVRKKINENIKAYNSLKNQSKGKENEKTIKNLEIYVAALNSQLLELNKIDSDLNDNKNGLLKRISDIIPLK